ncbi:hypothetical protein [Desulfosporosinus sp.]|uniref:hypothetical protein n=1 Tax=Desulfosporosinus sp. TaxID=157907 RepID=UPI0025C52E76|nr:hypothetical protein [Desulfosporosinus sp.]MBC2726967.1 HTH domain-containing protein [Desulfosporosinus sp.]
MLLLKKLEISSLTFDILLTTYLDRLKNSTYKDTTTAVLGKYLSKIPSESLSVYFTNSGDLNVTCIKTDLLKFICSLKSSPAKQDALEAIVKFWAFLHSTNKIPLNPLEGLDLNVPQSEESRRLKLIQSIQEKPRTLEELKQVLWVSKRTIQSDLEDLRQGKGLFPLKLEVKTKNNKVQYTCSVHPIFMAFNLTALAELMMGVKQVLTSDVLYRKPFEMIEQQIWAQLTPYAKQQLEKVLGNGPTYSKPYSRFMTEDCYLEDNVHGNLVYSMKAGKPILITYKQEESTLYKLVYILDLGHGDKEYQFRDADSGEKFSLPFNRIVNAEGIRPRA